MEGYLKLARPNIIKSVYNNPEKWGLKYKEYGKSDNIKDYSEEEISEMLKGVYSKSGYLLVDGDYFINVKDVIQAGCTWETVTSNVKLDLYQSISINQIRSFYVKNYYLITKGVVNGTNKHFINSYLSKIKVIHSGRGQFRGLYSISNSYVCVQSFGHGYVPKDLFHPIKFYINGVFFNDQYHISDFVVDSELQISNI